MPDTTPFVPYHWDSDVTGFLPEILDPNDPRPVADQLNEFYAHGGGYRPMEKWSFDPVTWVLTYPEDPPMRPLAMTWINRQCVILYPSSFLVILEPDGTFAVTRVD